MTSDKSKANTADALMVCNFCRIRYPGGTDVCPEDGTDLVPLEAATLVGTTFADKYDVLEIIGRGGMGVVYKARHQMMGNFVAIKVLYENAENDKRNLERFKREAQTLAAFKHENILEVKDFGVTEDGDSKHEYLITEFLEGSPLSDIIDDVGQMPPERALNLFLQTCDGLMHAHSKGVVHRDLKPGNIIITRDEAGRELVKIVDFGIAKAIEYDDSQQRLTKTGEMLGSPLYMSPEQCQGHRLDERSDLYSLGCVMYETLTGMPPLMGPNSFETMTKHVQEEPLPLRGAAPGLAIPELIDLCVMKTLQKDPAKRPQTALELKRELVQAAAKSRINYETISSTYVPKPFATGAFEPVSNAVPNSKQQLDAHEMQRMISDAVTAGQVHERESKRWRTNFYLAVSIMGMLLIGLCVMLFAAGSKEDPAPNFIKLQWRWAMDRANQSMENNDIAPAIVNYERAAELGRMCGPIYDKELIALLGLMGAYEASRQEEQVTKIRNRIVQVNLEHMEAMYNATNGELTEVTDLDHSLISVNNLVAAGRRFHIDPRELNPHTSDWYIRRLLQNANECFRAAELKKCESWLNEAIAMEERVGFKAGDGAASLTREFLEQMKSRGESTARIEEMEKLMDRAERAERKSSASPKDKEEQ